jgi:TPR repeat protein
MKSAAARNHLEAMLHLADLYLKGSTLLRCHYIFNQYFLCTVPIIWSELLYANLFYTRVYFAAAYAFACKLL